MDFNPFKEKINKAVLAGDSSAAKAVAKEAISKNVPATKLLDFFVQAIKEVGRLWEEGEYFLPELVSGASAVSAAMEIIKPLLAKDKNAPRQATVIIGTVQGDIHDIGKNLVGTMLVARGFEVIDLGTDISPEKFADIAEEKKAKLIGISALLTTTMEGQKLVVDELKRRGLRNKVKIIIGGAPVNSDWVNEIGADGTAPDAVSAANLAVKLLESK